MTAAIITFIAGKLRAGCSPQQIAVDSSIARANFRASAMGAPIWRDKMGLDTIVGANIAYSHLLASEDR